MTSDPGRPARQPAPSAAGGRSLFATASSWIPRGHTLPEDSWRARHRAVLFLLTAHAIGILGYSLVRDVGMVAALTNALVPAAGAFAASRPTLPRILRSCIASTSLMLTSAVVVHLSGGYIEAHFHFFAMIPVVALYEEWAAFGCGVAVVLLHHGVMGTVQPHTVYDHHSAWDHPWRFAMIHAALFASACLGSIVNWHLHEKARKWEQALTAQMRHQALHDDLTGLPNRTALLDHGERVLSRASRDGQATAVLMIDLDRFKEINDVLGHASGDVLLSQVGPRLAGGIRRGDMIARLGGDEFAAVLADADERSATIAANRLVQLLQQAFDLDGIALDVEASIGIAIGQPGNADIAQLLRQADIAMYAAKRARVGYTVFRADQDTSTRERLTVLGELRQAINANEIVLHYQPKITLPSVELDGVEALARWQHPVRGLLSPAEFIPAAESTGLIVPLTLHVLDLALAQVHRWRQAGHWVPVAVNLSPRCLAEPDLTGLVMRALERHDVEPHMLKLEITENTLAHDPARALSTLAALHATGVRISIDDFGTGYSSMSYLKGLPVDELKVDRSFVSGMLTHVGDQVLVRSLIDLGHNLGLSVVAEGVEDSATLSALAAAGCDVAQGYHLGRPMPAEDFNAWLAAETSGAGPLSLPRQRERRDRASAS